MPKTYVVNDGNRLLMPDGVVLEGGEEIELDDDLAERLSERITLKAAPIDTTEPTKAEPTETPAPVDEVAKKSVKK